MSLVHILQTKIRREGHGWKFPPQADPPLEGAFFQEHKGGHYEDKIMGNMVVCGGEQYRPERVCRKKPSIDPAFRSERDVAVGGAVRRIGRAGQGPDGVSRRTPAPGKLDWGAGWLPGRQSQPAFRRAFRR